MSARTMGAMQEIADRLANVPGRKNLIWLSTGFPRQKSYHRREDGQSGENAWQFRSPTLRDQRAGS